MELKRKADIFGTSNVSTSERENISGAIQGILGKWLVISLNICF